MFEVTSESRDGAGAGDHDVPYRFGLHPTTDVPFPFSIRQYARLLILRSRLRNILVLLDPATEVQPVSPVPQD